MVTSLEVSAHLLPPSTDRFEYNVAFIPRVVYRKYVHQAVVELLFEERTSI